MADYSGLPLLPLDGKHHVLLAVSGGSDSTALLHLAVRQCRELTNPPKLTAATVDHRLRSGSAAEVRTVEAMCAALGVRHRTLVWEGAKPATGIQDAARNARRNLIAAAAVNLCADAVFTGHTFDDQIETVAMRQKRGPGPGLAGIAPVSFVFNDAGAGEPVPFRRPLLGTSRAALLGFLKKHGVEWIEDPSNNNLAFERVAIRQELAQSQEDRRLSLAMLQQKAARDRVMRAKQASALIDNHAFVAAPGLCRIAYGIAEADPQSEALLAFRLLLAFAAGMPKLAEEKHAQSILAATAVHSAPGIKFARYGWGGALADFRTQGLYLMQEQRRSAPSAVPFSGRYRLVGSAPAERQLSIKIDATPAPASLIRKSKASEPVFDCPATGAIPASEAWQTGKRLRLLLNPWPDLVPSYDLDLAQSLSAICGAPALPPLAI